MTQEPAFPTGTVTFLFTDIEGSTRLGRELGSERYGVLLERHRALLRSVFAAAGGVEVGTEGDSFFVVFERPSVGLAAAAEGQRAPTPSRGRRTDGSGSGWASTPARASSPPERTSATT